MYERRGLLEGDIRVNNCSMTRTEATNKQCLSSISPGSTHRCEKHNGGLTQQYIKNTSKEGGTQSTEITNSK